MVLEWDVDSGGAAEDAVGGTGSMQPVFPVGRWEACHTERRMQRLTLLRRKEQELDMLKGQAEQFETALGDIRKRLQELETEKPAE